MNTLLYIARGRYRFVMCLLVDAFLWWFELWKEIVVRTLNVYIWVVTRWFYQLPHLSITLADIGLFKAYNIIVKWKNNIILDAEALTLKLEPTDWRCISFKLHVTNLRRVANTFEAQFSFTLYWRIFPLHSTSTGLENNSEIHTCIKPKITRIHATSGKIILKCRNNGQATKGSPKIVIKIKAAEVVFTSGMDIFIVNGRANKVSCDIKGRRRRSPPNHREHLIEMACLRLKLLFPKDSEPDQLSFRLQGTRVRITPNKLRSVLWTLNEYKSILTGNNNGDYGDKKGSESSVSSYNNVQLSKMKIFAEDLVLSLGTPQVPEIAAIKVCLDLTDNNWMGKSHCSGTIGIQGMSISDVAAIDPCIIIGNDLITASWRCSFNITHVHKRCLIFNAESDEILSMIVRPDYYEVLSQLKQFSFLMENKGKNNLPNFGESMKVAMKEYCPRTQISVTFEGVNLCLELDVFEKLVSCTLEDIRFQCTRDSENLSSDFTIRVIEVEDCTNNELAMRMSTTDGVQRTRSIHVTVIQEATNEKRSVSFQQLYGEIADFTISLEEELLLKLLVFCRITTKNQLWGEQEPINKESSLSPIDGDQSSMAIDEGVSLFFERLEMTTFNVVCCLSPKQELLEDLVQLKIDLGIPKGLPPCVENARLDFESFLRKGIYYRSFDALVRDLKRHYLKEVGRQSAKILGSLHLLGNVTELKDNIAEGLAELRETGDYVGFAGHVRNGLAESYYKIADSWSAYVRTPTKIPKSPEKIIPETAEEPCIDDCKQEKAAAQPRLLSSLSSSISGWVFSSPNSESQSQLELNSSLRPDSPEDSSVVCHSPPRDKRMCDCNAQEEDAQSSFSMSSITSPTCCEDVSQQTQKQLKGQEFLRRLKQSMTDTETEEKFICCLKLRYSNPKDKLNVLITSRKVYLMTVGQPSIDNVVLHVPLEKIFQAKQKEEGDVKYLELVMRIDGMQRLSLPSPNPEDSPLVRCDSLHLAAKAAKRINKAKKMHNPPDYCPCSVLMNGVNL